MQKYSMLRASVASTLPHVSFEEAPHTSDGVLALAHHPNYIHRVSTGALTEFEQKQIGFPWSPDMVERSRRSTGATIAACRAALQDKVAVNLAGGTHHAHADRGQGFCVFNDAAVAARLMQAERRVSRVAIIDLDVHQGDGTASILAQDDSVFTLSIHGERNYPFKLLIFLAGADPYEGDRLGRLNVSMEGMAARDTRVMQVAIERGLPVAIAMAGGYGRSIEDTVAIHQQTISIAARYCHSKEPV